MLEDISWMKKIDIAQLTCGLTLNPELIYFRLTQMNPVTENNTT